MDRLSQIALKYGTDKAFRERTEGMEGDSAHDYTPYYHELLKDREVKRVLEIGVGEKKYNAPSLRMWAEYFPQAEIYGCDIDAGVFISDHPRIHCFHCDQSNLVSLQQVARITGGDFDLIVDDGSHWVEHQMLTFKALYSLLNPKGVYIIEDIDDYRRVSKAVHVPYTIIPPHQVGRRLDHRIIVVKD
jgi:SAM-dependent methyltransferase